MPRPTLMIIPAILMSACMAAQETPPAPAEILPPPPAGNVWKLVWNDEFDGTTLDRTKWDTPQYKRGDAHWTARAVELDGKGLLAIRTFQEGERYYNACIRTRGKFERAFGYYVARIQLQASPGHWSAFWLMGLNVGRVGDAGRDGTEIDIMEKPWMDDRLNHALHWDGYGKDHKKQERVVKVPGVMQGFHDFAVWWTPDAYVFYVDGAETWRTNAGGVSQVPCYIKLSDEAKFDSWAGDVRKATLPDRFLVDHVRVYDLEPSTR